MLFLTPRKNLFTYTYLAALDDIVEHQTMLPDPENPTTLQRLKVSICQHD